MINSREEQELIRCMLDIMDNNGKIIFLNVRCYIMQCQNKYLNCGNLDRYGVFICTMRTDLFSAHMFPFLFLILQTWIVMCKLVDVSRKEEETYLNCGPGPHSQFLLDSELLIYFCCFVRILLKIILCSLLFVSVSLSGLCPWITFFWSPLESWCTWSLLN